MKKRSSPRPWDEPLTGLAYELAREQASALGRAGRKLESALAALAAFDAEHASGHETTAEIRAGRTDLVAAAGDALWRFVVQREACGLRDSRQVWRDYGVPGEVIARMGIMR